MREDDALHEHVNATPRVVPVGGVCMMSEALAESGTAAGLISSGASVLTPMLEMEISTTSPAAKLVTGVERLVGEKYCTWTEQAWLIAPNECCWV